MRRILLWGGLGVLAIGVAAGVWWGARVALGKLERRQSRQLTASAEADIQQGRLKEARMSLETATRLDSGNTRALRMLVPLQEAQGLGAEALESMGQLSKSGGLSSKDLFAYFSLALREQEFELARRLSDSTAIAIDPAQRHLLLALVATQAGRPAEAEMELRKAAEVDSSERARLELARFLITKGADSQTLPEALEILRGLSTFGNSNGVEALEIGLSSDLLPPEEREAWIAKIRSHPAANARHLLTADKKEVLLKPEIKAAVVRRTMKRIRSRPIPERVEAMAWALEAGEPLAAAAMVHPAAAVTHSGVFTIWLRALAEVGNWDAYPAFGEGSKIPPPDWLIRLFQARAWVEQGESERGREAYEQALAMTKTDREASLRVLVFLAALGDQTLFETTMREALAETPDRRDAILRAILPAVSIRRDAAPALRVFEIAAPQDGRAYDPSLQNEMDYLSVLAGQPVDVESLALRSREHPEIFPFRATHALWLLQEGRAGEALQVLEDCKPDVNAATLPHRQKAVLVATLAANDRKAEARFFAESIPPNALLVEEVRLISEQLRKSSTARQIPNSSAGKPQETSNREDAEHLLEGIPNPTQKAIEEALQDANRDDSETVDTTRKILLEAMKEAEDEARNDQKTSTENSAQP